LLYYVDKDNLKKNMTDGFFSRLLKNKLALGLIVFVILGSTYYLYKKKSASAAPQYISAVVTKGTITASVSGTGQVAATDQVDIKPTVSGTITSVHLKQGDQVKEGQLIATIDNRSAASQLAQAQAGLAQAQANYQKTISGITGTDLTTAQNAITNAQLNLDSVKASSTASITNAKQSLADAQTNLTTVTTQQNRAVVTALNNLYNAGLVIIPTNSLNSATVTLSGSYAGTTTGQFIVGVTNSANGLYYTSSGLGSGGGPLNRGVPLPLGSGLYMTVSTIGYLDSSTGWTIDVPNKASSNYLASYNAYQSVLETQTQTVNTAQVAIPKAQAALDQAQALAQTQLNSAQNQLQQAQQSLQDKIAPADKATVLTALASIKQAQASLITAEMNNSNTRITAPFDGIVAVLGLQRGDIASPATTLVSVTTKQKVASISLNEVDVAKVKVGQKATLTFSAVDGLTATGTVQQVDLIGTVTQNVVNFKVKILFDTQDDRIKPGMSVTGFIITDIKQDVLTVPSAAVKTSSGQTYVETLVNNAPEQHQVTVGLLSDTDTEVSGDIKEGDAVITQTITDAKPATAQQPASILPGLGGGRNGGFGGGGGGVGRQN
jgi:HlyD family secretion protein